jgi:hypothetical protein
MFGWFGALKLFWIGLPGPVKKLAIYGLIALAALYAFRQYTNHLAAQMKIEAKQEISKDLVKVHEKDVENLQKQLLEERKANELNAQQMRDSFAKRFLEQDQKYKFIQQTLQTNVENINQRQNNENQVIDNTSDANINSVVRQLSRQLATDAGRDTPNRETVK